MRLRTCIASASNDEMAKAFDSVSDVFRSSSANCKARSTTAWSKQAFSKLVSRIVESIEIEPLCRFCTFMFVFRGIVFIKDRDNEPNLGRVYKSAYRDLRGKPSPDAISLSVKSFFFRNSIRVQAFEGFGFVEETFFVAGGDGGEFSCERGKLS